MCVAQTSQFNYHYGIALDAVLYYPSVMCVCVCVSSYHSLKSIVWHNFDLFCIRAYDVCQHVPAGVVYLYVTTA